MAYHGKNAFDPKDTSFTPAINDTNVLSKVKLGGVTYYLKDQDARNVIDSIYADYLKASDKTELLTAIGVEETRAKGAEGNLQDLIDALEAQVGTSEDEASDTGSLYARIKQEIADRIAGDADLQNQIEEIEKGLVKVKSGDKILALDSDKNLNTTLTIDYDSENRKIQLKGIGGTMFSEIPADAFIKDGMLLGTQAFVADATSKEVTIKGNKHTFTGLVVGHQYLAFCFTDGAVPTATLSWEIADLQDLVDVYTAGNGLQFNASDNHKFEVKKASDSEAFLVVDSNGVAVKGVQTAINTAVAAEAKERGDADTALDSRIEVFEANGAHDVAALETRVGAAEGNITTLQGKVTTIEGKPAYNITSTQVSNWDNEVGTKADLAAEVTARTNADTAINNKIGAKTDTATADTVYGAIAAEKDRAQTAEAAAEAAAKSYADGIVNTEKGLRETADTALSGRLDVIEGTGEGSIAKAVADEAALRDAADVALGGRIDTLSGSIGGQIDAKINALDSSADSATVNSTDGTVTMNTISEVDGKISKGNAITNAVVYTKTKADTEIQAAKNAAVASAKSYTDTQVDNVNTKIADLDTANSGIHGHDVTATGTVTPQLTKSDKFLGVSTTNSESFVKSVGKTTNNMELASYVNSVAADAKSFSGVTVAPDANDAECLVFTNQTYAFNALGNVGFANAATGVLSNGGQGAAVVTNIDDTSKGTALGTVSLTNTGSTGIAFVESVAGATTTVNVSGTAANAGEHKHAITNK